MAEVAVMNHATEKFHTGSLCFETSCENSETVADDDATGGSNRMHRKHRFTILIGYGDEAGSVLKRCEQLKCKLGITTNIEFLSTLIDFFDKYNITHDATDPSATGGESGETESSETLPSYVSSYVYDVNCKTFKWMENSCFENRNGPSPSEVALTSSNCYMLQTDEVIDEIHEIRPPLGEDNAENNGHTRAHMQDLGLSHVQAQNPDDSGASKSSECLSGLGSEATQGSNAMTSPVKRKSEHMDENIETGSAAVSASKAMCQSSVVDAAFLPNPLLCEVPLTLADMTTKTLQLIQYYMEDIKNDLNYCYGFMSSSQKLKSFLDEYRTVTSTSFTVRSSRSYIKKRKNLHTNPYSLNDEIGNHKTALKSSKNDNNTMSSLHTSTPNISYISITDQNENMLAGGMKLPDQVSAGEMKRTTDNSFEVTHSDEAQCSVLDDESTVTGPLRWEFILGKPPIPFTGIPFSIIGNMQYQCLYASADIRTQRRKEKIEQIKKENPDTKTRNRRSMKRDCKAVMCIKSIVTFPEFSIVDKMQSINSKKGIRKLKATTLDNLREMLEKGESIGHPSFWVHVPLPLAHSTHDILESGTKAVTNSNNNNMDEITHILQLAQVAYQYSGQEKVDENIENGKR